MSIHNRRILLLASCFTLLMILIISRLYTIQIERSLALSKIAVQSRTLRLADSTALRGIITDRNYQQISNGGWKIKLAKDKNQVIPSFQRYDNNYLAEHLVGHLDSSTKEGANGVEAWFNDFLKAPQNIGVFAEKDIKGRVIPGRGAFVFPPVSYQRKNIVLTIDKAVQKIAEDVIDGKINPKLRLNNGAVVVMDIQSGDILALVSRPGFDQLNKALQFYFPGSVFKILVAAAAYEEGLISPQDVFNCNGKYTVNSKVYISCWKKEGHGKQSFTQAFANSCNTAFIEIGQRVNKNNLEKYIQKFNLKQQKIIGYRYQDGKINIGIGKAALANASIGQQGIRLSPIQIASMVATVANDGKLVTPRLIKEVRVFNGPVLKTFPQEKQLQVISTATAKKLQVLMEEVVINGTGTEGWVARDGSAGKTGSAQTGMKDEKGDIVHAWFAGYTPLRKPHYAIVIFAEKGHYGGKFAAPFFKAIAEKILNTQVKNEP